MIKLQIKEIAEYYYFVEDSKNTPYKLNIEFYDIPIQPSKGDFLYISEHVLPRKNSIPLYYGAMDASYGKEIHTSEDEDLLVLVTKENKYYLKRFYG